MTPLRIIFMGTPVFSVPILESLIEDYDVIGVVSQPDKEVGRKKVLAPTPTKEVAIRHQIPVFQPVKIRLDYSDIVALKPDLIVTCAYGQIIPKEILDAPKYGCINVHASLLPKLRGGAPIHHALMDGYDKTGITIMYMVEKMDAGDILTQVETPITKEDTRGSLEERLSLMGRDLLRKTIPLLIDGKITPVVQKEEDVTFGWNIKREEEKLDFYKTSRQLFNQIRGLNPHPGTFGLLDDKVIKVFTSRFSDRVYTETEVGTIVKIEKDGFGVVTGDGELIITEIQLEGKKRVLVKDYFHGIDPESLLGKVIR